MPHSRLRIDRDKAHVCSVAIVYRENALKGTLLCFIGWSLSMIFPLILQKSRVVLKVYEKRRESKQEFAVFCAKIIAK